MISRREFEVEIMSELNRSASRRDILKTSALLAGAPIFLQGAPTGKAIKVGLVGCGGRGTGAAAQALKADDYSELTAVADIYQERIDDCLGRLQRVSQGQGEGRKDEDVRRARRLPEADRQRRGRRPARHAAGIPPAAPARGIEANKHVFCEKPIAVDAPGVRHVLETAKMAKDKNLSLVSGFCWRYSNFIQAAFDQMHKGAIGDIVAYYGTYYTSPVKPMPPESTRPAGMSDVEWQIRNWYNFVWTCGDSLVEQAIHTVDKVAWAFNDKPPVSCVAVGGRQTPNGIGNIYDHFEVNYLYPEQRSRVRRQPADRRLLQRELPTTSWERRAS